MARLSALASHRAAFRRAALRYATVLFASIKEFDQLSFRVEDTGPDAKKPDAPGCTGAKKGNASDA